MKLTKKMEAAGIIDILAQNFNGSWVCTVDLLKIDLQNTDSNPREHSQAHSDEIGSQYRKECVKNPVLRFFEKLLQTIDGRHTIKTLIDRGITKVTCNVFFNMKLTDANYVFHQSATNNKAIGAWKAHASALAAGGIGESNILQAALDARGLSTPINAKGKMVDIACFTPVRDAARAGQPVLDRFLDVLVTFRDLDSACSKKYPNRKFFQEQGKGCPFLRGMLRFVTDSSFDGFQTDEYIEMLDGYSAADIVKAGAALSKDGRANACHIYEALMTISEDYFGVFEMAA